MLKLRLERGKLLLCQQEIGIVLSGERAHSLDLHFFGHNLSAQYSRGFDQRSRLTVNLQNSSRFLGLSHGFLGRSEFILGGLQLLLKEQAASGSFGDGQRCRKLPKLIDVTIGQFGGTFWVPVLDRDADQTIFSPSNNASTALEFLSCVRHALLTIFFHQTESPNGGVFDSPACQKRNVHVGGSL